MRPEQRVLCSPAPPSPAALLCFAAEARCTSIRRSQTAGDAGPKAPHRHYALSIYQVYHGYYMHTMYTYGTHQTQYAAWMQSVLCARWRRVYPDAHAQYAYRARHLVPGGRSSVLSRLTAPARRGSASPRRRRRVPGCAPRHRPPLQKRPSDACHHHRPRHCTGQAVSLCLRRMCTPSLVSG